MRTHWYRCLTVAVGVDGSVYHVHLLLLKLIGGVCAYGDWWRPPSAVRDGW